MLTHRNITFSEAWRSEDDRYPENVTLPSPYFPLNKRLSHWVMEQETIGGSWLRSITLKENCSRLNGAALPS